MLTAIDLFAGMGGLTEGAEMAGVRVVWAANHWREAVATHAANHPAAAHECQDLQQANFAQVPKHDLLLAAPACQGHAHARGTERPHHDDARATAWAVIAALEMHRPPLAVIENVREFRDWLLFPAWRAATEALGYSMTLIERNTADHGVPQERWRLFVILTRSRHAITIKLEDRPHVGFNTVAEWDFPVWSQIEKPNRAPATLARIASARRRFGDRFVMPYYGSGSGLTGRCLSRPIGTITTRERWALVDGDRMRMIHARECLAAQGFRRDYKLPAPAGMTPSKANKLAIFMIGNAVSPVQACDVITATIKAA